MWVTAACWTATALLLCGCPGPSNTCTPTNGGVEACGDGVDNNCDGQVDEGCVTECGAGQRQACGGTPEANVCQRVCNSGAWGPCQSLVIGAAEVCGNRVDDDCDSQTDEDCACDEGEEDGCGATPDAMVCVRRCTSGAWTDCQPKPPNDGTETCDETDDNCDGTVDEGCDCEDGDQRWCGGNEGTVDARICRQTCEGNTWEPCEPDGGDVDEDSCGNDLDDDCDGDVDETEACESFCGDGEAACEGTGRGPCMVPGKDCHTPYDQTRACPGEDRGECDPGFQRCGNDCMWPEDGDCEGEVGPDEETCDGLDNDCNDEIDDADGYDEYNNGECGLCEDLGTDPDRMIVNAGFVTEGGSDWYCFMGDDSSWSWGEDVEVRLYNIPSGSDFDIYLYRGTCYGYETLGSSTGYGNVDEEIEFNEETCSDCEDSAQYFVEVYGARGTGCYELFVDGLR